MAQPFATPDEETRFAEYAVVELPRAKIFRSATRFALATGSLKVLRGPWRRNTPLTAFGLRFVPSLAVSLSAVW